jgi:hypothetical protein
LILAKLRSRVASGHGSLKYIFSNSPDSRLKKVIGKKVKESFVYYQQYKLTERIADHQWYVKSNKFAVIMDAKSAPHVPEVSDECKVDLQDKSMFLVVSDYLPIQSVVVTAALASLITERV